MLSRSLFKKHKRTTLLGICLLSVCVFGLFFVDADNIRTSYRAQWAVELLGVTGALWLFSVAGVLVSFGLVLGLKADFRADKRVDRIVTQRNLLDKSVRRDP